MSQPPVVIVADTSPLLYLSLIDEIRLLPALFGVVLIPPAVHAEILHGSAPPHLRNLAMNLPAWLEVRPASAILQLPAVLGPGEKEALSLAAELKAERVLLDDKAAKRVAAQLGLKFYGTLRIIIEAAKLGFCDFDLATEKLLETNFYATPELLAEARRLASAEPTSSSGS